MQLSLYTDYSLRVLLYLGANLDERATMGEIAGFYHISQEHLRKVVHSLGKKGYIETYRGKNGGFELKKAASEINIGDIVADSEGATPVIDCTSQPCTILPSCSLATILALAEKEFFKVLREYSLADLLQNEEMTSQLVNVSKL